MGTTTAIGWTATVLPNGDVLPGATFNPWIGCTRVSQGCKFCYAEAQNHRYSWNAAGWGKGKPRKRTSDANWRKPLVWAKQAAALGITRRIFCASLADVLDAEVDGAWRADLWRLIDETGAIGGLEWLLLTKRIENAEAMLPASWLAEPPDYVRLGTTTEDQPNADKRIPLLLDTWRGKNFLSVEPMLGPVDLTPYLPVTDQHCARCGFAPIEGMQTYTWLHGADAHCVRCNAPLPSRGVQWVIVGGESGAGCRPMDLAWARDLLAQCRGAGVPYFFKQIGGHPNKQHDPAGWPEDLRVQEFPSLVTA